MPNILDLPTELVVHILGQVEYKSLIACRQACKKLRAIISRTPLLLYHLDLGGVGMCDNPSSVQPLHERRSKLLAYEEAWRSLDFSIGYLTVRVPPEAGWYIDQTLLRIITDHRSEADPILLEHKSTMIRVRAPLRGVAHSRWELSHGDGVELPSIRIDSSQDLLLQARGDDSGDLRVYAVNILTSTPHSEARVPFAILAGRIDGRLETINGDRFMIRMQSPSNSTSYVYEIWNWQDGSFVARLPSGVTDYSFLDSNHVLAYQRLKNPSTLIVVKLAPSHDDTCSTVAEFQLPEFDWLLGPGSNAAISCCSSAPSSGCVAIGDFYTEPDGTLVSLIIWDLSEDESEKCFQLLVPSTALLSYVSAPGLASDLPKIVPWHDWGVQHANIFQTTDILLLASSSMPMSGLRALPYDHPVRGTIHGHDVWMMEVRDFHPHRVARARAVSKRVPVHMRNWDVHECSIVGGRFMADGNPLVAGAPYISTRKELPSEALAGVIDPESVKLTIAEDCIIAYRTVEDDAEDGFGFTDVFIWSF